MVFPKIGNIDDICPYCDVSLDKRPKRTKKCPHCRKSIHVKTRPADRKKVLLTEEQAQKIEQQWVAYNRMSWLRSMSPEDRKEFETTKKAMAKNRGFEPADNDVLWSIYNKHTLQYAKNGDWGLYRTTLLQMAQLLEREDKRRAALEMYIEVSYLDANGPTNHGWIDDPELIKKYPPFEPKMAFQAPGVVGAIRELSADLGLSQIDLKEKYIEATVTMQRNMKLPVSPSEAWDQLKAEIGETTE